MLHRNKGAEDDVSAPPCAARGAHFLSKAESALHQQKQIRYGGKKLDQSLLKKPGLTRERWSKLSHISTRQPESWTCVLTEPAVVGIDHSTVTHDQLWHLRQYSHGNLLYSMQSFTKELIMKTATFQQWASALTQTPFHSEGRRSGGTWDDVQ